MICPITLSGLHQALGERLSGELRGESSVLGGVSTDTRSLKQGDLFVALHGPNFNGESFLEQAKSAGAAAAVVESFQPVDIPQWKVSDTRIALGLIAKLNRQAFSGTVYAVTGSAGKTTVKEMLASILATQGEVLATKGNLNNDIGAPLTLLSLVNTANNAVIELGASAVGEIDYTAQLTCPHVAILTNAMPAHLEGFGSLENIVKAKSEIFDGLVEGGCAVINLDDDNVDYWLDKTQDKPRLTFSMAQGSADVWASELELQPGGCYRFVINYMQKSVAITLPVMGVHMVTNALAAATACLSQGVCLDDIVTGLHSFHPVKGRMKPHLLSNGCLVVDDSYNASPAAVKAAIDCLVTLPGTHKVMVLGDMGELGDNAAELHASVGRYAALKKVDAFYAVGELSQHAVEGFNETQASGYLYSSRPQLCNALNEITSSTTNILIKGSRSAAMDEVVTALTEGD